MASSNPVLTRPGAFEPQGYAPYPGQQQAFPGQPGYPADPSAYVPQAAGPLMTLDDVITKSAITMGVLAATAAATMALLPLTVIYPAMIVSGIVGFVAVLFVTMHRVINPAAVIAYAAIEGLFIGALSKVFELRYPGIVIQAVVGTFLAAGVTLASYKYFQIKVTPKFRRMVFIGTASFAGVMLLNMVLSMFGINLGLRGVGGFSLLGVIASLVGIVLAVMNLMWDFDIVERGVANRAPASESWRAAFGLTVTMVWLYTELLRILSYFRSN